MINNLRFFCQRVLPLVYDDSLSFQELLYKVIYKINEIVPVVNDISGSIEQEVTQIMQEWLEDGTIERILGQAIDDLNDRVEAVEDRLTIDESSITDIQEDLQLFKNMQNNRKFLWIGDSYGMRHGRNWMSILRNLLGGNGQAISSYGFTPVGYQFISILNNLYSQESNPESITDIVIVGGWNDAREIYNGNQTAATLQQAIFDLADRAYTIFPNANVWVGFAGWQSGDVVQSGADLESLNITQRVYNYSRRKNLKVLQSCAYPMRLPYNMDSTYFHPNESTGADWLAYTIGGDLFGGCDYNQWFTIGDSAWVNSDGISNFKLGVFAFNDMIKWCTNYFTINKSTGRIGQWKPYYNPVAMQSYQHFFEANFEGTINNEIYRGVVLEMVEDVQGNVSVIWQGGLDNITQIQGLIKFHDIYTAESLTQSF